MQKTNSPKHLLLKWILMSYAKIAFIPCIMYLSLNIDKLMDVIQDTTHKLDPSLTNQTQEKIISQPQTFVNVYDNMTYIMSYISLGVAILAFMYASCFTIALVYHKTKLDTEYSVLNLNNIEAYKTDVNKMTPVLFFILLALSILQSRKRLEIPIFFFFQHQSASGFARQALLSLRTRNRFEFCIKIKINLSERKSKCHL